MLKNRTVYDIAIGGGLAFVLLSIFIIDRLASSAPQVDASGNRVVRKAGTLLGDDNELIPYKALGSLEKLEKIKVVQVLCKVTFTGATHVNEIELTWHGIAEFRFRERRFGAKAFLSTIVLKGDTGFADRDEMPRDRMIAWRNEAYGFSLSNLTPLRDKRFILKQLDEATIEGTRCKVVEAALPDRPTIKLYFAMDTGLLKKSEFMGYRGEKMLFENYYSDYQETDGVKHWRRLEQFRNGEKFGRLDVVNVRFFEEFDSSLFEP